MPGYGDSCFLAESFFYLIGYLIRNRGMLGVFKLFAAFLLGKQPVINRSCALSDSQNREASAVAAAMLNGLQDFVYIVRYLGYEDYIRSASDAGVQRQPARIPAHELNKEDSPMGACGGMYIVDDIGCNVNGTLEAEGCVSSENVVINSFRQCHDIHARIHQ